MTTATITSLPDATTPLTGAERVPMDQGGTTVDAPVQAIADLAVAETAATLATVATSGVYGDLSGRPTLGTAASRDVPVTGDASATQVVLGSDSRLSNSRTPTAHTQAWSTITGTPTSLADYGITDGLSTGAAASTYLSVATAATTYQPLSANLTALGANGTTYYLSRANHTGTQAATTITGLATVATSGVYGDLSGRPTLGTAAAAATTDFVAPSTLAASLAAKADLVAGVVPTSQIPAIAISDYLGAVGSQSAMLALTGQRGDWCLRTDAGAVGQWILSGDVASSLGNWVQITVPTAPVQSVNGQTGVIVLGASDVGALPSGALASPGPIGGTTPAAGNFTTLGASSSLLLPTAAPGTPAAGHAYRVGDQIRYRDSTATEQVLLYGGGNLANLSNPATARTNLGLTSLATASPAGGLSVQSGSLVPIDYIALVCTNNDETGTTGSNKVEKKILRAFTVIGCYWECATTGSTSSQAMPYIRPISTGTKANLLTANAVLAASAGYIDVSANLTGTLTGVAGDAVGVDLVAVGTGAKGHILTIVVRYS